MILTDGERATLADVFEERRVGTRSDDNNIFEAVEQIIRGRLAEVESVCRQAMAEDDLSQWGSHGQWRTARQILDLIEGR